MLDGVEQEKQRLGAGLPRSVEPFGGLAEPAQARTPPAGVVQRPLHRAGIDDCPEIAEGSSETGDRDAADHSEILGWQRLDMVDDDPRQLESPWPRNADLDQSRCETVKVVECSGSTMRRDRVATTSEGRQPDRLRVGGRRRPHAQHAGHRLIEDPSSDPGVEGVPREAHVGGLTASEQPVL